MGIVQGLFVTRVGIASFILTLATLFVIRGVAMALSNTRTLQFSREVKTLNRFEVLAVLPVDGKVQGIPFAILMLAAVLGAAWVLLTLTPFGRQVLAVGADREAATKAGLPVQSHRVRMLCDQRVLRGCGRLRRRDPAGRRGAQLRAPGRVPGDRGGGSGRGVAVWRARHGLGAGVRRGADPHHDRGD